MNASIEAARDGEAGKGFAVVADQIGNLAASSAQSAVRTRELIAKVLEEIENGSRITMNTAEVMKKVLSSMNGIKENAKNSSEGSKQQAEMMKEILSGIEQFSTNIIYRSEDTFLCVLILILMLFIYVFKLCNCVPTGRGS